MGKEVTDKDINFKLNTRLAPANRYTAHWHN